MAFNYYDTVTLRALPPSSDTGFQACVPVEDTVTREVSVGLLLGSSAILPLSEGV